MTQPASYTWPVIGSAPTVVNVRSVDLNTIEVTFSEEVVLSGALDPANYVISGGALAVSRVTNVSGSSQVFRVTTALQTAGASYTLVVSNVYNLTGQLI